MEAMDLEMEPYCGQKTKGQCLSGTRLWVSGWEFPAPAPHQS